MRQDNDRFIRQRAGGAAILVAAACVLAAGPAVAQRDRTLEVDVADCVEIESPAERFRCYEGRVDAALGEKAPAPDVASVPSPPPAPTPADNERATRSELRSNDESSTDAAFSEAFGAVIPNREVALEESAVDDDFGFRREDVRERQETRPKELFGTIASVRETVPNRYIITLENGQVWRQMRSTFYPLRPGHRVRIYSTNWGDSFRMSSEDLNGFIQVERVR